MSTQTDLLRRAADHIRYLAGDPVTWDADSTDWETWEVREQDKRGWWSRLIGRTRRPTRALHVAAWDPRTAHLVADWLESAAVDAEQIGADFRAVAVARALVGEA